MSLGEGASCSQPQHRLGLSHYTLLAANAKFPGQHAAGLPPSPSRENPGQASTELLSNQRTVFAHRRIQVFPHSDPKGQEKELSSFGS